MKSIENCFGDFNKSAVNLFKKNSFFYKTGEATSIKDFDEKSGI